MNLFSSVFFSGRTGSTSDTSTRGGSTNLPGYTSDYLKTRQGSERGLPKTVTEIIDSPAGGSDTQQYAVYGLIAVVVVVLGAVVAKMFK